jgi:hypothetical protein
VSVTGGHEVEAIAGKADDFRLDARSVAGDDVARFTNGCLAADGFESEANHAGQRAFDRGGGGALDASQSALEAARPDGAAR